MTEAELQRILANNPDLRVVGDIAPPPPPPPTVAKESLAQQFERIWRICGGPELATEYRFHPTRRWRFDYAHLPSKIAIEINGGTWTHGRHTRGKGYLADRDKVNAATALGWRVFELGTGQVTVARVAQIVALAKEAQDGQNVG
jgi:very-short-patch-repair endonuclease